jgi:hypothetical protein
MQLFKCFLMKRQFADARRIIEPREKSPYPGNMRCTWEGFKR